jgi:hypothetical protein
MSRATIGKRDPQIILKTEKRSAVLELGQDGKFAAKSSGWDENGVSLNATSSSRGQERPLGADPPAGGPRAGGQAGKALFRYRVR